MLNVNKESKQIWKLLEMLFFWLNSHLCTELNGLLSDWHEIKMNLLDIGWSKPVNVFIGVIQNKERSFILNSQLLIMV